MKFCIIVLLVTEILTATPIIVSGGPENDCESWIARLNDSRLMVIFDRNPDWASGNLFATFSSDNGNTWDSVRPIITDQGDQATLSFVQLLDDTIRLWYASNEAGNYGIYTAYSIDGLNWIRQGRVQLGWTTSNIIFDPTVILEPDSSLTMSYRVQGLGAFVAHCPYRGVWDTLRTLVGPQGYRPRIMKHSNGTYLLAYHRKSGSGSTNYDVFIRTSSESDSNQIDDRFRSNDRIIWQDSVRLTTNLNSHDPFANQAPDGSYLVYYAKYQSPAYNIYRRRSTDAINWSVEERITNDLVYNTQPHFFAEAGYIYLSWTHAIVYETNNDVYFERSLYSSIIESSFNSELSSKVEIIPNPSVNRARIIVNDDSKITIYNAQGQKIGETIKSKTDIYINTALMKNGIYFVQIEQDNTKTRYKLLISH